MNENQIEKIISEAVREVTSKEITGDYIDSVMASMQAAIDNLSKALVAMQSTHWEAKIASLIEVIRLLADDIFGSE